MARTGRGRSEETPGHVHQRGPRGQAGRARLTVCGEPLPRCPAPRGSTAQPGFKASGPGSSGPGSSGPGAPSPVQAISTTTTKRQLGTPCQGSPCALGCINLGHRPAPSPRLLAARPAEPAPARGRTPGSHPPPVSRCPARPGRHSPRPRDTRPSCLCPCSQGSARRFCTPSLHKKETLMLN